VVELSIKVTGKTVRW